MNEYVVSMYNHRSEQEYTFGPFYGDDELNRFAEKMETSFPQYSGFTVRILNKPKLVGTGQEVSPS